MIRNLTLLSSALCLLTSCQIYNEQRARFILAKGWVGPTQEMNPPPLYCYRTIGTPECYEFPLPGQEARLISAYRPKPVKICASKEKPVLVEEGYIEIEEEGLEYADEEPHYAPYPTSGPIYITPILD